MSWSSDGRYLATSNGENVSVWRLPAKDLKHSNKNMDARVTMPEDEETKEVGKSVERVGYLYRLQVEWLFWWDRLRSLRRQLLLIGEGLIKPRNCCGQMRGNLPTGR